MHVVSCIDTCVNHHGEPEDTTCLTLKECQIFNSSKVASIPIRGSREPVCLRPRQVCLYSRSETFWRSESHPLNAVGGPLALHRWELRGKKCSFPPLQ
jgi:hypothetical protein